MTAATLVLSLLTTEPVKSLAIEAGTALLADFLGRSASSPDAHRPRRSSPRRNDGPEASGVHSPEVVVPGRARLLVPSLRDNPDRAVAVTASLRRLNGVRDAQANHLTGRVLVLFDPALTDIATIRTATADGTASIPR